MLKVTRLAALLVVLVVAGGSSVVLLSGGSTRQSATGSVHPSGWAGTPKGFVLPAPRLTAVPTVEMFDTITLSTVPARPFALAGYTSGSWPTYLPLRAAFPSAHTVSIAVNASHHADCLDDEPGDATPAQAGPWVLADIKAGFARPCVYGDLSEMPAIQASIRAWLGSNWRSRVLLWLAWYRFTPGLVQGYDAVQWTDRCLNRNLDCSTVTLDFLKIAQPPYVAPKPKPILPVCYTHRISAQFCAAVKAKVASQQRAAASSSRALAATRRALARNHCGAPPPGWRYSGRRFWRYSTPYQGVCVHKRRDAAVFAQRARWFTAASNRLRAAN